MFGYVKESLGGLPLESADERLEAVQRVLNGIDKETSQAIFLEWVDWLRK
jgi:hypothetical protein